MEFLLTESVYICKIFIFFGLILKGVSYLRRENTVKLGRDFREKMLQEEKMLKQNRELTFGGS